MMHKTKTVNKNSKFCHLTLVGTNTSSVLAKQTCPCATKPANSQKIRYLTLAMMNRLWIPHTSSIVGLLDVGISKDNYQELSMWIATQLNITTHNGASNKLQQLERRFRDAASHYPEM